MRRDILIGIVLVFAVFATFWPTLNSDFVQWDDDLNITGNPKIQKLDVASLQWMFTDTTYMRRYVPLAWLNWAVLHHFFGLNPRAFHFEALLLHALNTVLIFWLLRKLLRLAFSSTDETPIFGRGGDSLSPAGNELQERAVPTPPPNQLSEISFTSCAAAGALLWALHPLRVEVAAWANCQIYAQSLFFLLGSLFFYFRSVERASSADSAHSFRQALRSVPLWISIFLFACSLLTYPTGIAFLVVLLVLDFFVLKRFSPDGWRTPRAKMILLEKIPFVIVTLAVGAVTLWARANMTGIWLTTAPTDDFSLLHRAAQACYIWTYFLWKPWLPFDLSPVYLQLVSFRPFAWPFLASAAAVIGGTALFISQRRRWPGALALWICHLSLLVPMLGLTEHPHFANDRYNYVSAILWSILLGFVLVQCWPRKQTRFAALGLSAAVLVACAVLSFQQTRLWKNSETLFQGIIARLGSDKHRANFHWRLALYHGTRNQPAAALEQFAEALKISPNFFQAHHDMAIVLSQQNRLDDAVAHYGEALRINPKSAPAHQGIALVFARQGRLDEALKHFETAVSLNPKDVGTRLNYASHLHQAGRYDTAFEIIFSTVKEHPDSPQAHFLAGNACMGLQRVPEALTHFQRAVDLKPNHAEARVNLGRVLAMNGRVADALPHFLEAVKAQPDYIEAHMACGIAYSEMGKKEEAQKAFREALRLAQATGRKDLAEQIEAQLK